MRFTFNRLAQVGGGRDLALPAGAAYAAFLDHNLAECRRNPVLGLKDNLLNIVRRRHRLALTGGCTGYGCGAAFNFVAPLPDGEVHACRKFPSPIGDIRRQTLGEIYVSEAARRYSEGPSACRGCSIRRRCGGCMAVTYGAGLDPFAEHDPMCFMVPGGRHVAPTA